MPDLSYDQIDALVDVDPIALRDVAWKLTQDVARLEAERAALRGVVEAVRALHKPTLQTVEWFHDQTGKGEALCCPSCRPEEPSEWDPPIGWAGVEPEGFVPSYNVSPCPTLAAVDQTAPSSPLETPHTSDTGDAGVVEGAGGSEAGERLIPDAVYEAAQRAFFDAPHDPAGIDAVVPLLIAEGRRQAAEAIRAIEIIGTAEQRDRSARLRDWYADIAEGTDDA